MQLNSHRLNRDKAGVIYPLPLQRYYENEACGQGKPSKVWSWREESNLQPAVYKTAALPIELRQPPFCSADLQFYRLSAFGSSVPGVFSWRYFPNLLPACVRSRTVSRVQSCVATVTEILLRHGVERLSAKCGALFLTPTSTSTSSTMVRTRHSSKKENPDRTLNR